MRDDSWVAELEFNDEAIGLIVRSITLECHDFALSRNIPSVPVEDQLSLVFGILDGNLGGLLAFQETVTGDAPNLATLSVQFSPVNYRLLAEAAKNAVALSVDID